MTAPPQLFSMLGDELGSLSRRRAVTLGDVAEVLLSLPEEAFLRQHKWRAIDHVILGIILGLRGGEARRVIQLYLGLRGAGGSGINDEVGADGLLSKLRLFPVTLDVFMAGEFLVVVVSQAQTGLHPPASMLFKLAEEITRSSCYDDCDTTDLDHLLRVMDTLLDAYFRPRRAPFSVGVVFGVDADTGRIYAHLLPSLLAWTAAVLGRRGGLDGKVVRDMMGFDAQPWEAQGHLRPGVRVRVQGDLVVEFLEVCPKGGCRLAGLIAVLKALSDPEALAARLQRVLVEVGPRAGGRSPAEAAEALIALAADALAPKERGDYVEVASRNLAGWLAATLAAMRFYAPLADGLMAELAFRAEPGSGSLALAGVYSRGTGSLLDEVYLDTSDLLAGLIASKALEARPEPAPFRATVNGSHVVSGYGTAAVALPPSEDLRLPTMTSRVKRILERLEGSLAAWDPVTVLRGLAGLLAARVYYGRVGDLYAYTVDGRLYFSHSEHGDVVLNTGGPAVVRVTTLNSVPPLNPGDVARLARAGAIAERVL